MNYLELPLIEFLELITNIESLKIGDLHSRDHNLTELEINEYFQKKTNDFDENLVKFVLQEMANFKGNTLIGIQADICYDAYWKNGWEIPKIKMSHRTPSYYVNDYDEMIGNIDRSSCSLFHYAFNLNKSKLSQSTETKTEQEISKLEKLEDLITHTRAAEIIKNIKVKYKNIKGKQLKLLLLALQQCELLPIENIASKFHRCCSNEFNWDIASYVAMNGHKFNEISETDQLNKMIDFLNQQKTNTKRLA